MKSQENSSLSSLCQFFGHDPGIILAPQYAWLQENLVAHKTTYMVNHTQEMKLNFYYVNMSRFLKNFTKWTLGTTYKAHGET